MNGDVIGITTFGDFTNQGGPGIPGIVRIDEARELMQAALAAKPSSIPPDRVLPVEPARAYPWMR